MSAAAFAAIAVEALIAGTALLAAPELAPAAAALRRILRARLPLAREHAGTHVHPHAVPTRLLTTAEQAAHADKMHALYARAAGAQRPVNGRTLGTGTLPRISADTVPGRVQVPGRPPWEDPRAAAREDLQQRRSGRAGELLGKVRPDASTGEWQAATEQIMTELAAMGPAYGQAQEAAS